MSNLIKNFTPQNKTNGWVLDKQISPDSIVQQGDLILFRKEKDPLKRAGIVVTADCDLSKKKHANMITLVSVVNLETVLKFYLLIEDLEKKRAQIESFIFNLIGIDPNLNVEAKLVYLEEAVEGEKHSLGESGLIAANFILDRIHKISVSEYKGILNLVSIKEKKIDSFAQQIVSKGDLMILPDLSFCDMEEEIAWVRHIWQMPIKKIAVRTSQAETSDGEKVARLDSPYRYRLTQLMSQVFADIGLPDIQHNIESKLKKVY